MSLLQNGFAKSGVSKFYTKTIDQSLRFEDGDQPRIERTPASSGSLTTWTLSWWVKPGNLGISRYMFSAYDTGASTYTLIRFHTDDSLHVLKSTGYSMNLSRVFRDPSAWYHMVYVWDTTNTTAEDRDRLYINGERITTFASRTQPSLNENSDWNQGSIIQTIGNSRLNLTVNQMDGYMAEVHFTDGTAYEPTDFGELKSGIWVAKNPSVTYGTNGFYLDFADGAAIGDDESGNTNDWTATNLVASDVVPDSPTNSFAVLSPLWARASSNVTYSEGNLKYVKGANNWTTGVARSSFVPASGKWYWEYRALSTSNATHVGVCNEEFDGYDGYDLYSYYSNAGQYYFDPNGTDASYGASWGGGDIIGVAYDVDNGTIEFYKNGTSQGQKTGLPTTGDLIPVVQGYYTTDQGIINFGQDSTFAGNETAGGNSDDNGIGDFKYTVPSGFLALCTSNLPDPAIDPAQDDVPEDYFNTVLYTGDGTSPRSITGVGFQPDWVWFKDRSQTRNHRVFDVVRGATKHLVTNTTVAEGTEAQSLQSFDSDGFTIGSNGMVNPSPNEVVAWNWKAGGTGVSNTDGSITSTVSANTDAGFSIVKYVGTQTAGDTVGHGLDSPPEMIIVKNLDYARNWIVYHKYAASDAETDHLHLNTTDALVDSSADWDDTAPTSTVFSLGNGTDTNDNSGGGAEHIAYCFHSVDGFSKVGSFVGNGNADGTFVYTGFRPKWIMSKEASASGGNWAILDAERNTYNVLDKELYPNSSVAEATSSSTSGLFCDFTSNGFKLRTSSGAQNQSGQTMIYLAFAEQPFKYSNAR